MPHSQDGHDRVYALLVQALVERIGCVPQELGPGRTFAELGLDSVSMLEVSLVLAEHVPDTVTLEDFAMSTSLGEAARIIGAASHTGTAPSAPSAPSAPVPEEAGDSR
ncbi:acyl carrier protein [Streptomyces sp. UNOB3_S3]|uniref:acyl carrier protein n=1 Tax=Streptomyces sp. UNOB3_S3 TaxID=2871682 RepID=UPI001E3C8754|nr:acyl carrier protein [Streptomyces sp. UNOB3_S3]MCC3773279.1 acyl carrier protein [Streptomyces sp. UNOB3_S3]